MGLSMTLPKEYNFVYMDFPNAYWSVESILYSTTQVQFTLTCYSSRDAKYKEFGKIPQLPFGASVNDIYSPRLYMWHVICNTADVFPNGVPLSEDEQKTAIYEYIKPQLNGFADVFEE